VLRGEGETSAPRLLAALPSGVLDGVPGATNAAGIAAAPAFLPSLDGARPARDLTARRRKYFIGVLDPCASIEFSRGCPWDCVFCSAWTFYGRSYRQVAPEAAVEDLARIAEPNVFLVDDVAFIHPEHGFAIGEAAERRGIRKQYYLETRCDVLLRNREVFAYWRRLGLRYLFLGLEAIDEEGLKLHRKRVSPSASFEAIAVARTLGLTVAINIIADPDWDERRFATIREWALSVPEIVHLTVNTPYPGTETWLTESRKLTSADYRLFDVQHAVLPTRLPLPRFYEELVRTQAVLNRKHLGARALWGAATTAASLLLRGQTNFVRMLWKFGSVYNPERQLAYHAREVRYRMRPPPAATAKAERLYVHAPARMRAASEPGVTVRAASGPA
jgi:hopanoid C-3 methylase HpnR